MVVLGQEECNLATGHTGSYRLRIAGLFAILAGSTVLILLPLLFKRRFQALLQLGSAFSCGVVLATAFVHILPDADAAMSSPCLGFSESYPWASTFAGLAVLIILTIENWTKPVIFRKWQEKNMRSTASCDSGTKDTANDSRQMDLEDNSNLETAQMPSKLSPEEQDKADWAMAALFLEGGIIFHSIFVGINYGVTENDSTSVALMVALIFHQGFDGLALGTAFVNADFSTAKYLILSAIFVLITPFGIALGMGISSSYAPGSKAALGCEAAFNAVSAGLLIFNALVNLILPVFKNLEHKRLGAIDYGMYVCLYIGYAAMAFIGKYA